MREEESREQNASAPVPPAGSQPENPLHGPAYEAYVEWCRQRSRPWYNQGWFWALMMVAGLAILVWQLGNIGEAVQSSAEATKEQTSAIRDQTQAMREQGSWLLEQLRAVERAISSLGHTIREAIAVFQSSLGS